MPSLPFFLLIIFFVPFHIRWEGFVVSGSHLFVIPDCFVLVVALLGRAPNLLQKDFQADTSFAGCVALVLLLAVGPDVFHGQGCFPMLFQMGFVK